VWPVVKSYVPVEDCFRATGYGTAGVVRRAPNGSIAGAFFVLALIRGGVTGAFGKDGSSEAQVDGILHSLKGSVPPFEPGPAGLAARYIWGAYAWSLKQGSRWPAAFGTQYLRLAPALEGSQDNWLEQFAGPGGLMPAGLGEVVRRNARAMEDVPDGQEVLIYTTATLALDDSRATVLALRDRGPDFIEGSSENGSVRFGWTREYPKGHWSPLSRLGGRQSLGSVEITGSGTMIAQAKTLSMASGLISLLRDRLGGRMRLIKTEWKDFASTTQR
jgi:hypothetical protein